MVEYIECNFKYPQGTSNSGVLKTNKYRHVDISGQDQHLIHIYEQNRKNGKGCGAIIKRNTISVQ